VAEHSRAYNILRVDSSNKRVSMEIEITHEMAFDQERRINEAIQQERPRLRNFIRRRVADEGDAEDILQDVFYELIQAYRMMKPIEQVGAWLYRVARNRIIDVFRRARPQQSLADPVINEDGGSDLTLEDLLPSPDEGLKRRLLMLSWWTSWPRRSRNFRRISVWYLWPMRSKAGASRNLPRRSA
jgi:RNA polymerase sigma factor (sigma-70 family)